MITTMDRRRLVEQHRLLDSAPLLALVHAHGGFPVCGGVAREHPALSRMWERAKADGTVTWSTGDYLAITLLGLHPMLVWGDDWLRVIDRCNESRRGRRLAMSDPAPTFTAWDDHEAEVRRATRTAS